MSARLPTPGEDHSEWGEILNNYLLVSHNDGGELKTNVVGAEHVQDNVITAAKLAPSVQASLLKADTAVQPVAVSTGLTAATNLAYYSPEDYGCLAYGDPVVNDAAIAAAIQDAISNNGVVKFTGKGPYPVSQAIEQDISRFVVQGNKTMLDVVDTFTGTYFWHLFSSADFPHSYNQGTAISGIIIQGAGLGTTPIASAALQIGHNTYRNNCLFSIDGVYIQGFATGLSYISNAWRVRVANSRVTGGTAISVAPGLSNFGESMLVENCMIESYNPIVTIGSGEWNFINCSFDTTVIVATGNCAVKLQGCHIEPHTVFPCVKVAHAQAMITLENTTLIIDPAVVIRVAIFDVTVGNTTFGLIIRNLSTIQTANYMPQTYCQNCLLVSGGGRVDMQGYSSNINGYGYAIATSNNLIYNGDGEKGTTAGWTTYGAYGPAGSSSFTADTTVSKYGTTSLKLSAQGGSVYVGQAVPCSAGQWVFAQCWQKFSLDSGTGNTFINLDFLSAKGDVIQTIGYVNLTATTDWTCRRQFTGISPVAPSGTAAIRVYMGLANTNGSCSAWYDNIILNVA